MRRREVAYFARKRERDSMKHFVEKCVYTKDWLLKLGRSKQEKLRKVWKDDFEKEKINALIRLGKEKDKLKKRGRWKFFIVRQTCDCDT